MWRRPPTEDADRGQAVIVGAVLMFGIAIVALASYQSFLVPIDNEQVEFDAYQDASQSFAEYRDSIVESSTKGYSAQQTVTLGTTYPTRVVAINPPPSPGRVETVESGNVTISNATAVGDAGSYWNGSEQRFDTVHLTYTPGFNRIDAAPMNLTGSLLYRETESGSNPQSAQTLINGKRISVTTLTGDVSETGVETELAIEPVSTSTRGVAVSSDSDPDGDGDPEWFVTVPTELPASTWQDLLAEEPNVVSVSDVSEGVQVELDGNVTYDLSLTRVEVREATDGGTVPSTEPHYLVRQSSGTNIAPNETTELTVEVRDRYDNPIEDVPVTFSGTNLSATTVMSDADGLASLEYSPSARGVKTIDAEFDGGDVDRERVSFTIRAHVAGGGAGGPKGTGFEGQDQFIDNGVTSDVFAGATILNGNTEITFTNEGTQDRTIIDMRWIIYLRTGATRVDELTFDGTRFDIPSDFKPLSANHTIAPGENTTLVATDFASTAGGGVGEKNSDVYYISVRYETPAGEIRVSTYVVSPV